MILFKAKRKAISILLCVALCGFSFYASKAQNQENTSFCIIAGATTGMVKPKRAEMGTAGIYGAIVGFSTEKNFTQRSSLWFSLSYHNIHISRYKNEIDYTSNWKNGPETQKISLETQIQNEYVEAQFIIRKKQQKLSIGGGFIVSYLINTAFDQKLIGTYAPPAQYPLAAESYNSSLKYVLEQSNHYTAPFHRTNIAPAINIGYSFNKTIALEGVMSYELLQNPKYFEVLFNPYRTFKTSLILTFKL